MRKIKKDFSQGHFSRRTDRSDDPLDIENKGHKSRMTLRVLTEAAGYTEMPVAEVWNSIRKFRFEDEASGSRISIFELSRLFQK